MRCRRQTEALSESRAGPGAVYGIERFVSKFLYEASASDTHLPGSLQQRVATPAWRLGFVVALVVTVCTLRVLAESASLREWQKNRATAESERDRLRAHSAITPYVRGESRNAKRGNAKEDEWQQHVDDSRFLL